MTDPNNPFSPPTAAVVDESDPVSENYQRTGRTVPVDHGVKWLKEGFRLFMRAPVKLMVLNFCYSLFVFLTDLFAPVAILMGLITTILTAGVIMAARAVDRGESPSFGYLFAGFYNHSSGLFKCGVFNMIVLLFLIGIPMMYAPYPWYDFYAFWEAEPGQYDTLLTIALIIHSAAVLWTASPLIAFENESPIYAIKVSYFAMLRNIIPGLVSLVLIAIGVLISGIVLAIPFGLIGYFVPVIGMFIAGIAAFLYMVAFFSIMTCATYCAIKDIFYPSEETE